MNGYTLTRKLFSYNPTTGVIINAVWRGANAPKGRVAGSVNKKGYRKIGVGGKYYFAHRIAWLLYYGEWPKKGLVVDHINQNKDDNRISNLRVVSGSVNNLNSSCVNYYKIKSTGKWRVRLFSKHVGYYKTEEEAKTKVVEVKSQAIERLSL